MVVSTNVHYISTELKSRDKLLALSLPTLPPLRQWSSICLRFPMCLSQRLLADLALT